MVGLTMGVDVWWGVAHGTRQRRRRGALWAAAVCRAQPVRRFVWHCFKTVGADKVTRAP
ncbi:MAG TPA: hypothetical protein VNG51_28285 [Ktedonobacteraceae bacterium]|nr:hypothetical protein [Ktedonobacteraceae bacterium]